MPHAISATCLLFAGFLVVGFTHLGGGAPTSPKPRTFVSGCSQSASTTLTNVGYYTPTTATLTRYRTVTKTVTKTLTRTKTVTYYRTRTRTLCTTITVTLPGSTTTETTTTTTTEPGPTVTVTVSATQSTQSGSAFTCPPSDLAGFAVGATDYTTDPIFCSYPAVEGEDPNDFYCTYSATTGVLVEDHDAGLCQTSAPPKP